MKTSPPTFVYGTLMSSKVVETLLGRSVPTFPLATLSGYSRHPVKNFVFPGTIPASTTTTTSSSSSSVSSIVHGCLLENMSLLDMKLLDWFEGDEYDRQMVQVKRMDSGMMMDAQIYIWKPTLIDQLKLDEEWSYDTFCKDHLDWYLEHTVRPCRREMERLGMTTMQQEEQEEK